MFEDIRARAEAAKPVVFINSAVRKETLEFFEHARDDIFALLAHIEAQQREIDELKAENQYLLMYVPRRCETCSNWDKSNGLPYSCKAGGCESLKFAENWKRRGRRGQE